ncbi:hypothetical protein C8R43DRAFT_946850 [Mycena crocata]|nr:hypothetical protein C8R43DRAFT_946850 [Mycena crocata]
MYARIKKRSTSRARTTAGEYAAGSECAAHGVPALTPACQPQPEHATRLRTRFKSAAVQTLAAGAELGAVLLERYTTCLLRALLAMLARELVAVALDATVVLVNENDRRLDSTHLLASCSVKIRSEVYRSMTAWDRLAARAAHDEAQRMRLQISMCGRIKGRGCTGLGAFDGITCTRNWVDAEMAQKGRQDWGLSVAENLWKDTHIGTIAHPPAYVRVAAVGRRDGEGGSRT